MSPRASVLRRNPWLLPGALFFFASCSDDTPKSLSDLAVNGDLSVESTDAAGMICDVLAQSCPKGQKCTIIEISGGQAPSYGTACVVTTGSIAAGMPCTRDNGVVGEDGCAAGLFCSGVGYPLDASGTPMRHCDPLCKTDSDCTLPQRCQSLSDDGSAGLCVTACQPFVTNCGPNMTCAVPVPDIDLTPVNLDAIVICRPTGPGQLGASCMVDNDCAANLICDPAKVCGQLCDDNNPCPVDGGLSCGAFTGKSSFGECS